LHSPGFEKLDRGFRTLPDVLVLGVDILVEKLCAIGQILKARYD
jgi:hypothetical protein